MNRLTEIKLLKDEKFNFALMTVIGGATHKVANMLQRKLRRIFKKYKLICWDNLLQLILWELLDNDDLDIEVI